MGKFSLVMKDWSCRTCQLSTVSTTSLNFVVNLMHLNALSFYVILHNLSLSLDTNLLEILTLRVQNNIVFFVSLLLKW